MKYNETVQIWLNNLLESTSKITLEELTAEEIRAEIEEVEGTISNERLWEKGSDGETAVLHTQNVQNLVSYLSWLESFK